MTTARERRPRPSQRKTQRKNQRNRLLRPALVAIGLLAVLLLGISLGRALADGPSPGGMQTSVRTLQPRPLPPARSTVTVTVTTG